METNEPRAHSLHKAASMKWIVGIVAGMCLVGCGVGVNDPAGQVADGLEVAAQTTSFLSREEAEALGAALASDADAETGAEAGEQEETAQTRKEDGVSTTSVVPVTPPGGEVAAPQDPIPAVDPLQNPLNPLRGGLPPPTDPGTDPRTGM